MKTEELLTLHEDTSAKCRDIMRRKNNDYTGGAQTDDPFANFNMSSAFGVHPALGVVLRIGDKLQRIRSFANDGALQVSGETIDDACEDIVNYAIIIKGIFRAQAAQRSTVAAAEAPALRKRSAPELVRAMFRDGLPKKDIAEVIKVDFETVQRWIAEDNTPVAAEEDHEPDHYGHGAVAATEPPATQYRLLEEGEIVQFGDEFEYDSGVWLEVTFRGCPWHVDTHYPHRRPLHA